MAPIRTSIILLLFSYLLVAFKPTPIISATNSNHSNNSKIAFNHTKFMRSLWLSPVQRPHAPRVLYTVDLYVHNYWQPNLVINWVALGDENTRGSGAVPVQPGYDATISYYNGTAYGPVYISVSFPGPPEDPQATRALYILDSNGYHCQLVTTEGVYVFHNMFFGNLYGNIWADIGDCN